MFKNKVKDLLKRVERKRTIQQELTSVTMALTRLNSHDRIGNTLVEARSRLAPFINYRGNGSEHQVPEQRRGELKTLQENVARLTKEYQELKAEKEGLSADFERLQDELAALDYTADPVALADHNKEINRTRMVIADIETAIAKQQEIIDNNQVESGENLQNHRQGILADQALGSNGKRDFAKELQVVDKEIASREGRVADAEKSTIEAQHAIAGLTRKLKDALAELEGLEADHKEMTVFLLKTEVATLDLEHQALVESMKDSHCRLSALNVILGPLAGENILAGGPVFNLNFHVDSNDIERAVNLEKARLTGLGAQC